MAQTVAPLDLYQWTPADPFRVSEVNSNFSKLAAHVDIKSSERVNSASGNVSWRARKMYDGTAELYCRVPIALPCSTVTGGIYTSAPMSILFPPNTINSIDCIQLTVGAGNAIVWGINQTSNSENSGVTFRCASAIQNASAPYVDILVKGVASNV